MEESILKSVKKVVGLDPNSSDFDEDLITFINSAFFNLRQLGVGPVDGFSISGPEAVWSDFTDNKSLLSGIKPYVQQKVRLQFDPPANSFIESSIRDNLKEYEWRLNIQGEGGFDE